MNGLKVGNAGLLGPLWRFGPVFPDFGTAGNMVPFTPDQEELETYASFDNEQWNTFLKEHILNVESLHWRDCSYRLLVRALFVPSI